VNIRKLRGALDHHQVRDILDAEHFAEKRGNWLNTTISIHPKLLADYPGDIAGWLSGFLNHLRIWCGRAGFGYFTIWVRENYEGGGRDHVHLLLYVPERQREGFEEAVRRWLPGEPNVVQFGKPEIDRTKSGQLANKALTYFLKQMTSKAWFSLGKRVAHALGHPLPSFRDFDDG
jgi:hypothetical protein